MSYSSEDNISLIKKKIRIELFETSYKYDLVYFDAFAPDVQPELWTEDIFKRIYTCMNNDSVLTTYSAKGSVKRALKAAGFLVENIPGPPGKREITRAVKE